ncbi:MAG: helix-hairpin-helix domain-containing protein [Candidatus Hodarchaeales archaeon]
MPSICICLSEDPLLRVFSFSPGDRITIHVSFDESNIPERYRLQILDTNKNSRLNRYGKGLSDIIIEDWPIPKLLREKHFGIWYVKIEDLKGKMNSFANIFFVEKHPRIEKPLLIGAEIVQIPEYIEKREEVITTGTQVKEIPILEPRPVELVTTEVTQIKGLGKTYATRLLKLNITNVYEFYSFENRTILAETMRVTDKKLNTMLQDAKRILDETTETMKEPVAAKIKQAVSSQSELLNVPGIGQKTAQKLSTLGITTIKDLIEFKELERLRKTLRFSTARLNKLLLSLGKEATPVIQKELEPMKHSPDDLVFSITGIGKKSAEKLNKVGINTVNDLLNAEFSTVKGLITKNRFDKWQKNASSYLSQEKEEMIRPRKVESELLSLPGIGQKKLNSLNSMKIFTVKDLINYSDSNRLRKTLRMSEQRFNTFIKSLKELNSN